MLTHKGTVRLETARLILRRAQAEDAQAMYDNWASEPQVTKYLTWPTYESVESAHWIIGEWMKSYAQEDVYQWMIVPKALGEPIGTISVVSLNDRIAGAEIGYCIGSRWWGQGIMPEALQAVIDFLFEETGMNRIEARHDVNNPNSGKVMRRCGMVCEGTARQAGVNNQGVCDEVRYAILRSEWAQAKKAKDE